MELTRLTSAPTQYQVLHKQPYAGYVIAFCIDVASHELYLAKHRLGDAGATWYIIHLMGDTE